MNNKTIYKIEAFADIFDVPRQDQTRVMAMLKTAIHKCPVKRVKSFTFDLTSLKIDTEYVDEEESKKNVRKAPAPKAKPAPAKKVAELSPEDI